MKIMVINGPNLNFIGIRELEVYGKETYKDLVAQIKKHGKEHNVKITTFQSNYEGAIIDCIQKAYLAKWDAIIINPGALTHYSYALHDALKSIPLLKVEVHLSNVNERDAFRKINVIKDVVDHQIVGKGFKGYLEAIDYLVKSYRQN